MTILKSSFKLAAIALAAGLTIAATGAQAAQHQHSGPAAQTGQTTPPMQNQGMQGTMGMDAMMADPAMRQKMMEHMAQCREMMNMMMSHMQGMGKTKEEAPPPPK